MTQEQDAANWQALEQYKQLRAEKNKREAIAQRWGDIWVSKGMPLSSCGGILPSLDLSDLPDKTTILEAQRELKMLNEQIASLRERLRIAGMDGLL